jgi:sugar/nucleoside kinase (ribokinase family)
MLGCVGDLLDDVAVRQQAPVRPGADTPSIIVRRRGGSAANVAAAAARAGHRARFIGQVGDDAAGRMLVHELTALGVDVRVRQRGRTGTVVALVDEQGERTMLTDRGAATELALVEAAWALGLHTLHVPLYSLAVEPLATSSRSLIAIAHRQGATISIDVSSVTVLDDLGIGAVATTLAEVNPDVVLANADEAAHLGRSLLERLAPPVLVVKRGPLPALVTVRGGATTEVPVPEPCEPTDTTGAGDAFAGGFLPALASGQSPIDSVLRGHDVAMAHLLDLTADR